VNLSSYDPTTYFLLLQFRVVVTGILFEILFSKRLSRIQWLSLILLTVGCIIKQVNYSNLNKSTTKQKNENDNNFDIYDYVNSSLLLIMIQVFSSCLAGVYNEYLLKEKDNNVDIMLQNFFMYFDSIVCNFVFLFCFAPNDGSIKDAFSADSFKSLLNYKVILIMINNAAIGIVTSFFLRFLNSILKAFAR
jgi:integrin beta 8